jgi:hypothetical protein
VKKNAAFIGFVLMLMTCGQAWAAADNQTALKRLGAEKIFMERKGAARINLDVFTKHTQENQLIRINDYFMKQFYGWYTHIFIYYFDDKKTAQKFNETIKSKNLGRQEKDRLGSHIIAMMEFNSKTGIKIFQVRRNNDLVTVKKY